jgi:hypothetical protein
MLGSEATQRDGLGDLSGGPSKPTSRSPRGPTAARHGHRVLFATAAGWVTRLTDARRHGRLP